jgi:hypothetical protein
MRKYIIPGSVRIYGLPGTDENFGVRDNGAGQMWSETKRVGSIAATARFLGARAVARARNGTLLDASSKGSP